MATGRSAVNRWAAVELSRRHKSATTQEEKTQVQLDILRARKDPAFAQRLAEAGEHGRWSSGPAMKAKLGLAAGTMIPGVNLVAGPALAALAIPTAMESYERSQSGLPWGWQAAESAADLLFPGIGRGGTSLLRGFKGSKAAKEAAEQAPRLVTDTGRVTGEGKKILRGQYQTDAASPINRSVPSLERAKARAAETKGLNQALEEEFLSGTPLRRGDPYSRSVSAPAVTGSNLRRRYGSLSVPKGHQSTATDLSGRSLPLFGHTVKSAKSRIPSVKDLDVPEVSTARLGKMRKSYEQAQRDVATRPTATEYRRGLTDAKAGFKTDLMRSLDDLPRGRPGLRLRRPTGGPQTTLPKPREFSKSGVGGAAGVKISKLGQAAAEYGDSPSGQAAWKATLDAQKQAKRAAAGADKLGRMAPGITEGTWVKGAKSGEWVNTKTRAVVTEAQIAKLAARIGKDPSFRGFSQKQLDARARVILMPKKPVEGSGQAVEGVGQAVEGTQEVAGVGTKLVDDATQSVVKPVVEGVEQAAETVAPVLPKVGGLPEVIENALFSAQGKINVNSATGPGQIAALKYIRKTLLPNLSSEQLDTLVKGTQGGKLTDEASQLMKETVSDLHRTVSGKAGGEPVKGMIGLPYKSPTQAMEARPAKDVQQKIDAALKSVGSDEGKVAQDTMSRWILMDGQIKKLGNRITKKDLQDHKFSGLSDYMKWNDDGTLALKKNGSINWLGDDAVVRKVALNVVQMNRINVMSSILEQMVGRTLKGKKVPGGASGWAKRTFSDPTALDPSTSDLPTGIFKQVLEKGIGATGKPGKGKLGTGQFEAYTAAIGDFEKELAMLLAAITGASALGGASLPSREI